MSKNIYDDKGNMKGYVIDNKELYDDIDKSSKSSGGYIFSETPIAWLLAHVSFWAIFIVPIVVFVSSQGAMIVECISSIISTIFIWLICSYLAGKVSEIEMKKSTRNTIGSKKSDE